MRNKNFFLYFGVACTCTQVTMTRTEGFLVVCLVGAALVAAVDAKKGPLVTDIVSGPYLSQS